jgi:hypothetical protein
MLIYEIENDESIEKTRISGQLFLLLEDMSVANSPTTASNRYPNKANILLLPEGYYLP